MLFENFGQLIGAEPIAKVALELYKSALAPSTIRKYKTGENHLKKFLARYPELPQVPFPRQPPSGGTLTMCFFCGLTFYERFDQIGPVGSLLYFSRKKLFNRLRLRQRGVVFFFQVITYKTVGRPKNREEGQNFTVFFFPSGFCRKKKNRDEKIAIFPKRVPFFCIIWG